MTAKFSCPNPRLHGLLFRHRKLIVLVIAGALAAAGLAARGAGGQSLGWWLLLVSALVSGFPVVRLAIAGLQARQFTIPFLVSIAAAGAIAIGEVWEAAAVTFLYLLGSYLEERTLEKTRSAVRSLVAQMPRTARLKRGAEYEVVPAEAVQPGQVVVVLPGDRVPVDGVVTAGRAALDTAALTGEPLPAEVGPGDSVLSGSVSRGGHLEVEARRVGPDTTFSRLVYLVAEAQEQRPKVQRFLDRFARWYTPAVILAALGLFALTGDAHRALTFLVIGCPGALVVAAPVAVVAGLGNAARRGILIKGGERLERIGRVDLVALDKTGTLTLGRPEVALVEPLAPSVDADAVLALAAGAEQRSEHHLAGAILERARKAEVEPVPMADWKLEPGLGVVARVEGAVPAWAGAHGGGAVAQEGGGDAPASAVGAPGGGAVARGGGAGAPASVVGAPGGGATTHGDGACAPGSEVLVGNRRLLTARGVALTPEQEGRVRAAEEAGFTVAIVAAAGRPLGLIGITDPVRVQARGLTQSLRRLGVRRVVMLTGDNPAAAGRVAERLGVDEVRAGLSPQEKVEAVRDLQRAGHVVAMVGDGINDAPALAVADVSIAMGATGTQTAIETADVALMSDRLERLPEAIGLSRRIMAVVRQNVALAVAVVLLLLAGVVAGGVTLSLGMLVHEASVLLVILNGMRLLR